MEVFSKPAAGGIIEKSIDGIDYVLIQERYKEDVPLEKGLIEIPAGKIREFENIYDALRREIWEETGLNVIKIEGEDDATILDANGYKVLNYTPFASAQNIEGTYPVIVQIFICTVKGELVEKTNESRNIRWVSLRELNRLLHEEENKIYPMHINTLKMYLKEKFKG